MKTKAKLLFLLTIAFILTAAFCAFGAPVKPGPKLYKWERTSNNGTKVFLGETLLTGWQQIDGDWYLISDEGYMLTGWQQKDGAWFYLTEVETDKYHVGACVMNATTPDGHTVGENGALNDGTTPTGNNPYGHDCVVVNIPTQSVNVYFNNILFMASPCVTGTANNKNRETTPGKYTIYAKETDRYLQGKNEDGSEYKSWVSYWMPFNWGQGLHDASWRDKFGGTIYTYAGSHGCVNLPPAFAAQLYGIAYVGMPVYVYN